MQTHSKPLIFTRICTEIPSPRNQRSCYRGTARLDNAMLCNADYFLFVKLARWSEIGIQQSCSTTVDSFPSNACWCRPASLTGQHRWTLLLLLILWLLLLLLSWLLLLPECGLTDWWKEKRIIRIIISRIHRCAVPLLRCSAVALFRCSAVPLHGAKIPHLEFEMLIRIRTWPIGRSEWLCILALRAGRHRVERVEVQNRSGFSVHRSRQR